MSGRERELLLNAFDSNWIAPLGPHVDALEGEFSAKLGMAQAVAVSSGTAALHLALRLVGVGSGDEVLTSTLTFTATANAITYCGATPVFLDSDRQTWNMDPNLLEDELRACDRRAVAQGGGGRRSVRAVCRLWAHRSDLRPLRHSRSSRMLPRHWEPGMGNGQPEASDTPLASR
jgi:dTDP-4-amino-4,6-dideoxygalactose transaminase